MNIYLSLLTVAISFCLLLMSCTDSDNTNNSENTIQDTTVTTNSETFNEVLPDPNYNYDNCPKAWSLEEIMASPDSFCLLALLGDEEKLTEFPNELSKIPHLRGIDARRNRIKHVPKFLSKLEELDLSANMLDKCPTGLENLKNLVKLQLDRNSIKKIDEFIFEMKNLEELRMSDNSLNEIPTELCSLTKLRVLSFSGNNLTTLPAEIGKLVNLEELYISDQEIESLPNELGKLQKLNTLYIGSNYSGGGTSNTFDEIPACIFELETLKTLSLSYGRISEIPLDIKRLSKLEILDMSGNRLTDLPEEIKSLKNLKNLYLGDNDFSEEEQTKIRSWFGDQTYIEFEVEIGD